MSHLYSLVTSAKEVMFSVWFVLFVCLFVWIIQNLMLIFMLTKVERKKNLCNLSNLSKCRSRSESQGAFVNTAS